MNRQNRAGNGRALGLVMVTVALGTPALGCAETHPMSDAGDERDAPALADSALGTDAPREADAGVLADAELLRDTAIAWADAFPPDAGSWDDPDAPDTGYPDGIRG